jgi:hypothetical protein
VSAVAPLYHDYGSAPAYWNCEFALLYSFDLIKEVLHVQKKTLCLGFLGLIITQCMGMHTYTTGFIQDGSNYYRE